MEQNSEKKKVEKVKVSLTDDDIINLNNDNSFSPINEEEEKAPLTEEEKGEVRKKLLILLIVIFIALIFFVIVLIFDPFAKEEPKKEEKTEQKEETKPVVNQKTLKDYEDGEIDISNDEIVILTEEIIFKDQDHYENNALTLFLKGNTNIANLTDAYKLFLLGKTTNFNEVIAANAKESDFCKNKFEIDKATIDALLKERFNTTVTKYENFLYHYYDYDGYNRTIKFTYKDEKYTGECYQPINTVKTAIQQDVVKAEKKGNMLYLDCKVIFINEKGVYKDPAFKNVIATGITSDPRIHLGEGNIYRYTFEINQNEYYLTNISLQK